MELKIFKYYPNFIHLMIYIIVLVLNKCFILSKNYEINITKKILILDTLTGDPQNGSTINYQSNFLKKKLKHKYSKFNFEEYTLNYSIKGYIGLIKFLNRKKFSHIHMISPNISLNLRSFGFLFSLLIRLNLQKIGTKISLYIWDAYDIGTLICIEIFKPVILESISLSSKLDSIKNYNKFNFVKTFEPTLYFVIDNQQKLNLNLETRLFDLKVPNFNNFNFNKTPKDFEYHLKSYSIDLRHYKNYEDYLLSLENIKFVVVLNILKKQSFNLINKLVFGNNSYSHLVGRNFEAVNASCLLFTQKCAEIDLVFKHKDDAVIWQNFDDLIRYLDYYSKNLNEANFIAKKGKLRLISLQGKSL